MTGAANGTSNRAHYDRWFRYPAGFSPSSLQRAFKAVGSGHGRTIVDPFCGSATVGTTALLGGGRFVGIEAHPLIANLAQVKVRPSGARKPASLRRAAARVADAPIVPIDHETDLVTRCFTPDVLGALCGMREAIDPQGYWHRHLTWALLATLRDVASKKVGWPYQRPGQDRKPLSRDPRARFLARVESMAADLGDQPIPAGGRVLLGDSRQARVWHRLLPERDADACVCSPPYLNNYDYADATRLEVYFLGEARTWHELCQRVRSRMLIATTQQSRVAQGQRDLRRLARWPSVQGWAQQLTEQLESERQSRPRGKEYDRLLPSYLVGVGAVLINLRAHVRRGAKCAWVVGDSAPYGVYVDTPRIIEALAQDVGFESLGSEHLRDRGQRWSSNGTRHAIALEERLLLLQAS